MSSAIVFAGWRLGDFARAMIPPQAVAISTQSSLASLAGDARCGAGSFGCRSAMPTSRLPLAVALFRATGPAMNVAVAIYVAYWMGIELNAGNLIAGFAVAAVASYWAVSLPGALSFVTSIAPIALAMGVPIEPLALLIAVEVIPDITRTLGNVTWDVTAAGVASQGERASTSETEPAVRRLTDGLFVCRTNCGRARGNACRAKVQLIAEFALFSFCGAREGRPLTSRPSFASHTSTASEGGAIARRWRGPGPRRGGRPAAHCHRPAGRSSGPRHCG